MGGLGILHSQNVLRSAAVKVSPQQENLHTNPTRNQTQNQMYEIPGFYPQTQPGPQRDTMYL